jgi:hypothetical protein
LIEDYFKEIALIGVPSKSWAMLVFFFSRQMHKKTQNTKTVFTFISHQNTFANQNKKHPLKHN